MPYNDIEEAIELSRMGKGSLVSSIITNDMKIAMILFRSKYARKNTSFK